MQYYVECVPMKWRLLCDSQLSLQKNAQHSGLLVRVECGGRGICGKCRVQIIEGETSPVTAVEQAQLTSLEISKGIRFACQTKMLSNSIVSFPFLQECAEVTLNNIGTELSPFPLSDSGPLGIAIDLGTTTITALLVDLASARTMGALSTFNPQVVYGSDIMSRISYALEQGGSKLQESILLTLNYIIKRLIPDARKVTEITIVGNSAMHHLLLGLPVSQLGAYPYTPVQKEHLTIEAKKVGLHAAGDACVHLLPLVGGFIGSDHVAMILATGIDKTEKTMIGLDIGTNTEIVLAHHGVLRSASCASGPAFEGGHIRHGMSALSGAIDQVSIDNAMASVHTIGNVPPLGLCGSGVLAAISELLKNGLVDPHGLLTALPGTSGNGNTRKFILVPAEKSGTGEPITFTQKDIQEVQLAKSAIRAGIETLLAEAQIGWGDLDEITLTGGFSQHHTIESLMRIGIFPLLDRNTFRILGNAAVTGAILATVSPTYRERATQIASCILPLELATHPHFRRNFTRWLRF